jgi:hypothetical protein
MTPSGLLLGILLGAGMHPEPYAEALEWCLDDDSDVHYHGRCSGVTLEIAWRESIRVDQARFHGALAN